MNRPNPERSEGGTPAVSVVMPVYRGGQHLLAAADSVLGQTMTDLELILVDDACPADSARPFREMADPRVRVIRHERNQGANVARNTGVSVARAPILAFLDQDDLFLQEKLAQHLQVLQARPDVGFTYGPRFELNHSAETVREVWMPPEPLSLWDVLSGFPLSPSDMVVRRDWFLRAGGWDAREDYYGGEFTLLGRLLLEGCGFARVPAVLNCRRYHSGRVIRDLAKECSSELGAQERVLSDPRCPAAVAKRRDEALANTYVDWAYPAFVQHEEALGRQYLDEALRLAPSLAAGTPPPLAAGFLHRSLVDDSEDHEATVRRLFAQSPVLIPHTERAVQHGYVEKGVRALIWGRVEVGREHLRKARQFQGSWDDAFSRQATYALGLYASTAGAPAGDEALTRLTQALQAVGWPAAARRLAASVRIDQAFGMLRAGNGAAILSKVASGVVADPRYLANRGVASMTFRAAARSLTSFLRRSAPSA
jgi:hypothetical protein